MSSEVTLMLGALIVSTTVLFAALTVFLIVATVKIVKGN